MKIYCVLCECRAVEDNWYYRCVNPNCDNDAVVEGWESDNALKRKFFIRLCI